MPKKKSKLQAIPWKTVVPGKGRLPITRLPVSRTMTGLPRITLQSHIGAAEKPIKRGDMLIFEYKYEVTEGWPKLKGVSVRKGKAAKRRKKVGDS